MCFLCKCPLVGLPGPWTWNTSIRFDNDVVTPSVKEAFPWSLYGYAWFPLSSVHHIGVTVLGLWCLILLSTIFSTMSWRSVLFGEESQSIMIKPPICEIAHVTVQLKQPPFSNVSVPCRDSERLRICVLVVLSSPLCFILIFDFGEEKKCYSFTSYSLTVH